MDQVIWLQIPTKIGLIFRLDLQKKEHYMWVTSHNSWPENYHFLRNICKLTIKWLILPIHHQKNNLVWRKRNLLFWLNKLEGSIPTPKNNYNRDTADSRMIRSKNNFRMTMLNNLHSNQSFLNHQTQTYEHSESNTNHNKMSFVKWVTRRLSNWHRKTSESHLTRLHIKQNSLLVDLSDYTDSAQQGHRRTVRSVIANLD